MSGRTKKDRTHWGRPEGKAQSGRKQQRKDTRWQDPKGQDSEGVERTQPRFRKGRTLEDGTGN